ncbi:MAG: PadR family transcriptional regulator [Ardenticatenaceae bacterium]
MSTKHVILGLLDIMPMSGYDLEKNLKISMNSLWAATYSQIYPALHKLEREGLVSGEKQQRGKRRKRVVYSLTPAGHEELASWMKQPVHYLPFRDPFKLWASNINSCPPEVSLRNIDHHIELNSERAEHFEQMVENIIAEGHPLIQERLKQLPKEEVERLKRAKALIFQELASQARFEVESAKRMRRYVQQLYPDYQADEEDAPSNQ